MANFKLGKIQYGFLETATSGGTLTLVASSKQYQIFTGSSAHTLKLPDATTMATGLSFVVVNLSTGVITIQKNDASTLTTVAAGSSVDVFLTDISTSNGVERTYSAGTASNNGIGSIAPGAAKTSDYSVVAGDSGSIINVDTTAGAVKITLPAPASGFNVTIRDSGANAHVNAIRIARNGSELIDGIVFEDFIMVSGSSISFISDGTNWFRIGGSNSPTYYYSAAGRGLFGGGDTGAASNVIDYVTIATTGNATDFGDLTQVRAEAAACSSATRAVWGGGQNAGVTFYNIIDYVTIASAGNATDFGDLTIVRGGAAGAGSNIRGLIMGGYDNSTGYDNIDYITIATTGNAMSFGTLTTVRNRAAASASSTRALMGGGNNTVGTTQISIDYVTIATTGNGTTFGNMTQARYEIGGASNSVRALFGAGFDGTSTHTLVIDYVTIATTGNATNFGNSTRLGRSQRGACASPLRVLFAGHNNGGPSNIIDYVTIATTGNAVDFGDLSVARSNIGGCSNSHGGIYG